MKRKRKLKIALMVMLQAGLLFTIGHHIIDNGPPLYLSDKKAPKNHRNEKPSMIKEKAIEQMPSLNSATAVKTVDQAKIGEFMKLATGEPTKIASLEKSLTAKIWSISM